MRRARERGSEIQGGWEWEGERERQRESGREGEGERQRQKDRQTDRQTDIENSNSKALILKDSSVRSILDLSNSQSLLYYKHK